jgi:hypothetical protein
VSSADAEGLEDVLDELLAVPPEGFTEARNAAAKRLRAQEQRELADTVKGLPRPPLSLWALNGLAHTQPELIETFLAHADRLRQAYRSGGDIRAAMSPEREAEARVVAAAAELARADGRKVTETVMERLRQTARAAAADAAVAAELRAGRLLREPEAPSISELLGSLQPASEAPKQKAARPPDRRAERTALREQIATAEAEEKQARAAAREAADAARAAESEWQRAAKVAERIREQSHAAAERLQELRQRLGEL